ncbi:MAG: hypothetical protein ABIT83_14765 [Massilia sp.]
MSSNKVLVTGTLTALLIIAALTLPSKARADDEAGMVVARDPVTGQTRMATPAEVKALRQQEQAKGMAPAKAATSPAVRRDNGTLHKHMGESALVYTVARREADGKLATECVQGADAAEAAQHQEHTHENR